jgi:3-phenylpropionate/trans-cinnamate dioxygenase ferredoxin reductase subunit
MSEQFVIVGAGLAGAKAAETLRAQGFSGRITLFGDEPHRPYERPPLSKGLLLGATTEDDTFVHEQGWYADNDVQLRTGCRVESIDRTELTVTASDGSVTGYHKLLLATGSSPRRLDVPGAGLDGVLYLRTLPEATRLAAVLADAEHVVVVGAGWIGLEVAAAARSRGASVTIVETLALPLQRVLGDEVAQVFLSLHQARGVAFHGNSSVREFRGGKRVTSVVLGDGTELLADVVVAGVGISPNVEPARQAGLATDNGILVDSALRTSDPRIFAAGDVANADHPLIGRHIRVEHWANAVNMGEAAAKAMMGQDVVYDRLPYFYSDQFDLGMEYSGYVAPGRYDYMVFRGDPSKYEFLAFWVDEGRVIAGMNTNIWDVQDQIQALVRAGYSGHRADLARLADPAIPLEDLLADK